MMLSTRKLWAAAICVAATISLSACGGDDKPDQAASTPAAGTTSTGSTPATTSATASASSGPQPTVPGGIGAATGSEDAGDASQGHGIGAATGPRVDTSNATPLTTIAENDYLGTVGIFNSPTGNIACVAYNASDRVLRCDLFDKPGQSGVIKNGVGASERTHDSPPYYDVLRLSNIRPAPVQYGQTITYDGYACSSAYEGMTCVDTSTQSGFFISREKIEGF